MLLFLELNKELCLESNHIIQIELFFLFLQPLLFLSVFIFFGINQIAERRKSDCQVIAKCSWGKFIRECNFSIFALTTFAPKLSQQTVLIFPFRVIPNSSHLLNMLIIRHSIRYYYEIWVSCPTANAPKFCTKTTPHKSIPYVSSWDYAGLSYQ